MCPGPASQRGKIHPALEVRSAVRRPHWVSPPAETLPARKTPTAPSPSSNSPTAASSRTANRNSRRSPRARSDPCTATTLERSAIHPGSRACQNAAGILVRAQHQISRPEIEQGKVRRHRHAVGLQRGLGIGECAHPIGASRAPRNVGRHRIVAGAVRRLFPRPRHRRHPQQVERGGPGNVRRGHRNVPRSIGQRTSRIQRVRRTRRRMVRHDVIAIVGASGVGELRKRSDRRFSALQS